MLKKQHWPAILWALFILVICGIPGDKIPTLKYGLDLFADKIVHAFIFGLLLILMLWDAYKKSTLSTKDFVTVGIVASLYGALIEVLQATIFINRSGDVLDWLADTVGILLAWLILVKIPSSKIKFFGK